MIYIRKRDDKMLERKNKYRLMVIAIFFILLVTGIWIGFQSQVKNTPPTNTEPVINTAEENQVNIYQEKPVISKKTYDIEVVYEDYYATCKETLMKKKMAYATTLEELKTQEKEEQIKENKEYQIVKETQTELIYRRELPQNCPNHFEVKIENGTVVVYQIVNTGVTTKYREMDVPQELIRPEMLEELNTGILVNTKEELNLLIEDLES